MNHKFIFIIFVLIQCLFLLSCIKPIKKGIIVKRGGCDYSLSYASSFKQVFIRNTSFFYTISFSINEKIITIDLFADTNNTIIESNNLNIILKPRKEFELGCEGSEFTTYEQIVSKQECEGLEYSIIKDSVSDIIIEREYQIINAIIVK